jgi:hypothetical protein
MRRVQTKLASGVLLAILALVTACAGRAPRGSNESVRVADVDTIAAQLSELELQRIELLSGRVTQGSSPLGTDAQIAALRARLHALPDHARAERVVATRVVLALDARQSTVTADLQNLRSIYTDKHPLAQQLLEEMRLLDQRRTEIRNASTGAPGAAFGTR